MTDPLVEKAMDDLDWDYGGDMVDYLGQEWRDILRPHIKAAVDASTERLREERDGLRESIRDWRRSHDVVATEAMRTKGLEAAARSAFAEVERLRGLLARLEWAGVFRDPMDNLDQSACVVCEVASPGPHAPNCWLAAELGNAERPASRSED
jgi:hypothetical protein